MMISWRTTKSRAIQQWALSATHRRKLDRNRCSAQRPRRSLQGIARDHAHLLSPHVPLSFRTKYHSWTRILRSCCCLTRSRECKNQFSNLLSPMCKRIVSHFSNSPMDCAKYSHWLAQKVLSAMLCVLFTHSASIHKYNSRILMLFVHSSCLLTRTHHRRGRCENTYRHAINSSNHNQDLNKTTSRSLTTWILSCMIHHHKMCCFSQSHRSQKRDASRIWSSPPREIHQIVHHRKGTAISKRLCALYITFILRHLATAVVNMRLHTAESWPTSDRCKPTILLTLTEKRGHLLQ
mmetsp:Transcript_10761/g.40278  ORF Transcript_10761/g.40278 Transcript_10761/m.40278 type:complete len:293 (+) Transcript_10761:1347-2225(+)